MDIKVSIIIPVYNVEKYIEKCLKSIVNQTFKKLEIICIDDGSTDSSGLICDSFANDDTRIKVEHIKHDGNSRAINKGLSIFTGDYVCIVDPDDWVEENYVEEMATKLMGNDVDVVCFNYYVEKENVNTVRVNAYIDENILNAEKALYYCFRRDEYPGFAGYLWNKLFKKRLFLDESKGGCGIRLNEKLHVCADILAFTTVALQANGILYDNVPYYHYVIRQDSLMHCSDLTLRESALYSYEMIIDILIEKSFSKEVVIWAKRFYAYHALCLAEIAKSQNNIEKLIECKNAMQKYMDDYIQTNLKYPDRIERFYKMLDA